MQPLEGQKRDPAPSRVSYRLQRFWLTPLYRSILRTGVPAACVLGVAIWYLSDEARVDELKLSLSEMRNSVLQRPEFMVNLMRIEEVSDEVAEDIREITAVDFPISSFDLDLAEMRARIQELDAVAQVNLVVRAGGVLDVEVVERMPAIVWRSRDSLELLDASGHRVAALERRSGRADLPLIAGEGADTAVAEALALLEAAQPIAGRVRGLLRVGARRWDVVLDRSQRIMLPEDGALEALERVLALDDISDLLRRDLIAVDVRDPRRPTLRLTQEAVEFLHQIKAPEEKDDA